MFDPLSERHYKEGHSFSTQDTNHTQIALGSAWGGGVCAKLKSTGSDRFLQPDERSSPIPTGARFAFPTKSCDSQKRE